MDSGQHERALKVLADFMDEKERLPWYFFKKRAKAQRNINDCIYNMFHLQLSALNGHQNELDNLE